MPDLAFVLVDREGCHVDFTGIGELWDAQTVASVRWRLRGNAAGATVYGAIHLVSGNLTLTGAAGVAGAFWSLEHLAQGRMAPLIVSHVAWDVWIFLVRPTA